MKPAIKYIPLKTQGKVDDSSYCVYNSSGNQVLRVYTVEDTGCARDINTRYSVPLYDTGYSIYKDTAHTQPMYKDTAHTQCYILCTHLVSPGIPGTVQRCSGTGRHLYGLKDTGYCVHTARDTGCHTHHTGQSVPRTHGIH